MIPYPLPLWADKHAENITSPQRRWRSVKMMLIHFEVSLKTRLQEKLVMGPVTFVSYVVWKSQNYKELITILNFFLMFQVEPETISEKPLTRYYLLYFYCLNYSNIHLLILCLKYVWINSEIVKFNFRFLHRHLLHLFLSPEMDTWAEKQTNKSYWLIPLVVLELPLANAFSYWHDIRVFCK